MQPTIKQPLFIISGASGVGKSTMCELLFQNETDYIVLESDILWHDVHNTPDNNYKPYRQTWLNLCANISQFGKPVVLCGSATPEQFESLPERELFTDIHYLAVVSDPANLEKRMREGRAITDKNWIDSSVNFNDWLIKNGESHGITILDTTNLTPQQAAQTTDAWIQSKING